MIVLDQLRQVEDVAIIKGHDSSSIFYNLVRYYSNSFKGWGRKMSYSQLNFLNGGKKKHELLNLFSKNRLCDVCIDDIEVAQIASKIFEYIKNLLVNDKHPHTAALDILKNMKLFDIPSNFRDERRNTNNYIEYYGDYSGTYAHDVMGYTNEEIDIIFDGEPDAYWNID